jgi:hypothetical protein
MPNSTNTCTNEIPYESASEDHSYCERNRADEIFGLVQWRKGTGLGSCDVLKTPVVEHDDFAAKGECNSRHT